MNNPGCGRLTPPAPAGAVSAGSRKLSAALRKGSPLECEAVAGLLIDRAPLVACRCRQR